MMVRIGSRLKSSTDYLLYIDLLESIQTVHSRWAQLRGGHQHHETAYVAHKIKIISSLATARNSQYLKETRLYDTTPSQQKLRSELPLAA